MTDPRPGPSLTYAGAGVDNDARGQLVDRIRAIAKGTHGPEVLAGIGPFAGLYRLGSYREPVLVSSTDSVGTKVRLASLLGRFESIGADLVHQNVNDIITTGAEPIFFLDYIASSTLDAGAKAAIVEGIASACREAGCALVGGETADMPDIYGAGDLDLVGFVVGAVERDAIIDGGSIVAGDALVGLPSSGLHTNGYSLVRRAFGIGIGGDVDADRARLDRHEPELGASLGDALLEPHRGYANAVAKVRDHVKGIAHITGGGLVDNVPRVLPERLGARIDRSSWDVPLVFGLIQRAGNIAGDEMYRTFNMGIGLVLAVDPAQLDAVRGALPDAIAIGEVVAGEGTVLG